MKGRTNGRILRDAAVAVTLNQVSSDLGEEVVILHLGAGIYYGLDGVGAHVWRLIEESGTVGAIEEAVVSEYDVDREEWADDLDELLRDLSSRGLITIGPGASDPSDGGG